MSERIVEGHPNYRVTSEGRVFNVTRGRELKPQLTKDGYARVTLSTNGKTERMYLHRLVASHFLDNPEGLPQVNHINEDKAYNSVANLEWCSNQYNSEYSKAKEYFLIDPEGNKVTGSNLSKLCREKGLCKRNMSLVNRGKKTQYKGWTKGG